MPLGINFGSDKTKSSGSSTTDVDQTKTTDLATTQQTTGTNQQTGSTSQASSSATTSGQQSSQKGSTSSDLSSSGVATQLTQLFSDDALKGLESLFSSSLAGAGGNEALSALTKQAANRADEFDPAAFVAAQVGLAQQEYTDTVKPTLAAAASNIGGNAANNSMVNLLTQIASGRQAREVAGVQANAEAQASDILNSILTTGANVAGQESNALTQIGDLLRGAIASSTGTQENAQTQVGQTTQEGRAAGTSTATAESETTTQLLNLISQLVQGTQTGTENVSGTTEQDFSQQGKTKSSGFSLGLG